ncbi:MAG: VacJ family lipoprotein [Deltaproteobacteria bacterium]|nr:VacJ family lipoprotein [Deltaproteobacteria bacterium]
MKYAAFFSVVLSLLLGMGCAAHNQSVESKDVLSRSIQPPAQVIEKNSVEQQDLTEVDSEFLDDSLDFLDEEDEEIEDGIRIADPIEPWNKVMFQFNDKLYFWVLKPVAKGYRVVVPHVVRNSVRNFFINLTFPIRFVNSLLQAKGQNASDELGRFLFNSTVGVLGFWDAAGRFYPNLNPAPEDLGQTLGNYRIGHGFYIVWPILGPSTVRDSVGLIGDGFLNPVTYVEPATASLGITAYDRVNGLSFRIGDYEALKDAALDPYEAFRDAYIQYRYKKVAE